MDDAHKPFAAPLLEPIYLVDDIPAKGLEGVVRAKGDDIKRICELLELISLEKLVFQFNLEPSNKGAFTLSGSLIAEYTQKCVVTLEPIPASMDEEVLLELWPSHAIAEIEHDASDASDEFAIDLNGPEPIIDDRIEVGQLAFEIFASKLDLYPRKHGAEVAWKNDTRADEIAAEHPFAALSALKNTKQ